MPSAMETAGYCGGILAKIKRLYNCKTFKTFDSNVRKNGSFPERTQNTINSGMNAMFQQQCNIVQVQNNGGFCPVTFSIHITFTEYRTAITKNTKTVYNFMNGCNYD